MTKKDKRKTNETPKTHRHQTIEQSWTNKESLEDRVNNKDTQ